MNAPHVVQGSPDLVAYPCVMSDAPQVKSFADLIREGRERKNMSLEDLEQATGVHRNTLSRWQRGLANRPEPEHVRTVCRVLDIDPRQAAVSLGYLSAEEVDGPARSSGLPAEVEEILTMLEDPRLPAGDRKQWVEYLRYLHQRALDQAG